MLQMLYSCIKMLQNARCAAPTAPAAYREGGYLPPKPKISSGPTSFQVACIVIQRNKRIESTRIEFATRGQFRFGNATDPEGSGNRFAWGYVVQRLELALAGEELLAELLVGMPSSTNHAWVVRNCTDLAQRACA